MADAGKQGLGDLADDTLGFGVRELTTARDLVLRPQAVLGAWMEQGPDGGGLYARPLRLYLAMNAVLMLMLFLRGGAGFILQDLPGELLADMAARSGKSVEAFVADADNWMSFIMVPLLAGLYALAAAPLLRWWDPDDLGWRRGFRAAFGWLSAWTILIIPLAWWSFSRGPAQPWVAAAFVVLSLVSFLRMGRGRWYRSIAVGTLKASGLTGAVLLAGQLGMGVVIGAGLLGAMNTP